MNMPDFLVSGWEAIAETRVVMLLRDASEWIDRKMWTASKRQDFYRRLAIYVENGKRLAGAIMELHGQAEQMAGPKWKHRFDVNLKALSTVARRVSGGDTLADALKGWAPTSERGLIRAGEGAGTLPNALRSAVANQAVVNRIIRKIVAASFDPLVMLGTVIYLIDLVGTQMVPPMLSLAPASTWPPVARLLLPMAAVSNSPFTAWALLAFVALIVASIATLPYFTGPVRTWLDDFPPWSIYRGLQAAAWIGSLADLLESGTPLSKALLLQEQWANPWLKERLSAARIRVQGGAELGAAFIQAGHGFPERMLTMDLQAFAGFRDFPATIKRVSAEWLESYETRIIGTIVAMGTFTNILVNVVMIVAVFGMMSMQSVMQNAAH